MDLRIGPLCSKVLLLSHLPLAKVPFDSPHLTDWGSLDHVYLRWFPAWSILHLTLLKSRPQISNGYVASDTRDPFPPGPDSCIPALLPLTGATCGKRAMPGKGIAKAQPH